MQGPQGKPTQAATVGGSTYNRVPHSSGKQRAVQKLQVLAKKMGPSCMQACGTGTQSDQKQEDVQLQDLSSGKPSTGQGNSSYAQPLVASVHVDSVDGKQQVLFAAKGGSPCLSRLRGIFGREKCMAGSSKQAPSDWVAPDPTQ